MSSQHIYNYYVYTNDVKSSDDGGKCIFNPNHGGKIYNGLIQLNPTSFATVRTVDSFKICNRCIIIANGYGDHNLIDDANVDSLIKLYLSTFIMQMSFTEFMGTINDR